MNIAIISDTHMNQPPGWFLRFYDEHLARADVLVHCGDITGPALYHHLLQHPNLVIVRGNCDWDPAFDGQVQDFAHVELPLGEKGVFQLAACHGWGPRSQVSVNVARHFGPEWDLVCFGHTHKPYFSDEHGVLMVNPGSLGESASWARITVTPGNPPECAFESVCA